ncbi:hypothetical protein ACFUJR_17750 [Streptomyces sp. NPDC057271]|uniref:hypothetical protein n=1 Tax=unclassified Streptomyces TaxID=2593676 RepID=UPI0036437AE6
MRTRHREPQTLGEGTLDRMARILAARNIDPSAAPAQELETVSPLEALSAGMPPRYRAAVADHPQVLAWVRTVTEAAVAPNQGARRQVTTGPSLLMAGVV